MVRVSEDADDQQRASRVFRVYLAANQGAEMAQEREQLQAVVHGPLKELCRQHAWDVSVVDLRRNEIDSSDPRLLNTCMQGIESCRLGAYVSFLGEKYGHVLTRVPEESVACLDHKPWLASIRNRCLPEAQSKGMAAGLLELEATAAFLLAPSELPGSRFYLRRWKCLASRLI